MNAADSAHADLHAFIIHLKQRQTLLFMLEERAAQPATDDP